MTEPVAGDYRVEFVTTDGAAHPIRPESSEIRVGGKPTYFIYTAGLTGLPLGQEVSYRVWQGARQIAAATFSTRRPADQRIRFAITGDLADEDPAKYTVAEQMVKARPEFVLVCGDVAYDRGRFSNFETRFWPVYNAAPGTRGTTIMQSVPFYVAMGNHDAEQSDLGKYPDAFATFYYFHAPRVAAVDGSWRPFIPGPDDRVRDFEKSASRAGFPNLCLYSFDQGAAHFLALDSNSYEPLLSADYREWIRRDLANSHARWKIVFFHHPGFQSATTHANHQKMRLLAPLFEETGVDVVFAGHVHNYQRSKPLHFEPKSPLPEIGAPVRGKFVIDQQFDGTSQTQPNGIIYIVTGAGGAELVTMASKQATSTAVVDPDTKETFTAKYAIDRHSFTMAELDAHEFDIRQLDDRGTEIDHIRISKP